jgi:uncharacterized protein DUF4129
VGERWREQLRAGLVIGLGLLLAAAASLSAVSSTDSAPGATLVVGVPDAVRAVVLILLGLSAVLLLALQRPRPLANDSLLAARVHQRRPVWNAVLALLPFLLLLGVACYISWNRLSADETHPIEQAITAIAGLLELLALARKPPTSVPLFDAAVAGLVLLFALAVFALMLALTLADHLAHRRGGRAVAAVPPSPADGPDDDPRAMTDARTAIVCAYARFERALTGARAPRAPAQTPGELMRATLARFPLPAPPLARLTSLFELARFSDRPLDLRARDEACDCLETITTALAAESAGQRDRAR